MKRERKHPFTLAIDVGGSGIKAAVLDARGRMITGRLRVKTPHPCPPRVFLSLVRQLAKSLPAFDRVSVGFPGPIREGRVLTAANLGDRAWRQFDLEEALMRLWRKPVRVLNDADMQGFAVIRGKGLEMVVTLGTGVGTALFRDGELMPHMELAHHPFKKGKTYEELLGDKARRKTGLKKWSRRIRDAVDLLLATFNFDRLYLGGGNAKRLKRSPHPAAHIVSNTAGVLGGINLWRSPNSKTPA